VVQVDEGGIEQKGKKKSSKVHPISVMKKKTNKI